MASGIRNEKHAHVRVKTDAFSETDDKDEIQNLNKDKDDISLIGTTFIIVSMGIVENAR